MPSQTPAPTKIVERLVATQGAHRGNVVGDLQFSWFIRPTHETECNGFYFKAGHLHTTDLKPFDRYPFAIQMAEQFSHQKTVLYVWRRNRRGMPPLVFGATITDAGGRILERRVLHARNARATVAYLEEAARLI